MPCLGLVLLVSLRKSAVQGPRAMGFKIEGKYRVHPTTKLVGALGKVRTTHTQASEEALAANAELRLRQPGGDKQVSTYFCLPAVLPASRAAGFGQPLATGYQQASVV